MNKAAKTSESTSPSTEAAPSIDAAAAVEPPRKTVGFQRSSSKMVGSPFAGLHDDADFWGIFDDVKQIGKGHFAKVKLVEHISTQESFACKVLDKSLADTSAGRSISNFCIAKLLWWPATPPARAVHRCGASTRCDSHRRGRPA